MNIKQKLMTAAAAGSVLASIMTSGAFAATSVTISGNGAFSHNGVGVVNAKKNVVRQSNATIVGTKVVSVSNTGGNKSSFNVGGGNSITTGSTTTTVNVDVAGGTNTNSSDCGCPDGTTTVNVTDNGAFSHNGVLVLNLSKNVVNQSNTTVVGTKVVSVSNTGLNSSSFNVGDGGNTIDTGDTDTTVDVTVTGSSNSN